MLNARYLTMICAHSSSAWYAMETDLTKGVQHWHHRHLTDRTLTLAAAHIISATKGEKTSALQYWPSTLNLADQLCMSSSARLRTSWRETECTRWGLRVLTDILQAAVDVTSGGWCSPLQCEARPLWRQCEEAARQQGLLCRCSRGWKRNRPAVWERRVRGRLRGEWEEREIGEVGRWGDLWRVPRNDAASHAPSTGVQAKPRVASSRAWPRENARFGGIPRACVKGALTRMWA
jgi:hypothetical protein